MTGPERSPASWITRHWPLKLLAVALAFGAWLVVTTDNRVIQDFKVYIDVEFPDETVLVGDKTKEVTLRLRGSGAQFRRLDNLSMKVELDLADGPPGERTVRIQPDDLRGVPPGLEIVMIDPQVVTFELARRQVAELPVQAKLTGMLASGFELYGVEVEPDRVRVSGPENQVADLDSLATDPVPLTDREESFSVTVPLNPGGGEIELPEVREVTVRVRVDAPRVRRTFADVPVMVVGAEAARVDLAPSAFDFEMSGPPRIVDRLGAESFRLVADVADVPADGRRRPVRVRVEWTGVPLRDRVWLEDVGGESRTVRARVEANEDR